MLTIYGLKNCSTCKKLLSWLDDQAVGYEFIDYRAQPIASEHLVAWAQVLGGWHKLVNRASTTWRNLDDRQKQPNADSEWLALIADYPALVRRPVIVKEDGRVMVGFKEAAVREFLA